MPDQWTNPMWANPLDWLLDKITKAGPAQTSLIAIRLASSLDSDAIQDIFQSEMACDGYFIQAVTDENKWHLAIG